MGWSWKPLQWHDPWAWLNNLVSYFDYDGWAESLLIGAETGYARKWWAGLHLSRAQACDGDSWKGQEQASPASLDFILALPAGSLERLSWIDNGTCNETVLTRVLELHGQSLKSLEWCHSEAF
ncbi:hypothetical protein ACJZ2D_014332 [Fusarium nematophilum]